MTPNVTTLHLLEDYSLRAASHPLMFGPITNDLISLQDISTYVPLTENILWQLRRPDYYKMHKLDAMITGLPEHLCSKLALKFRNKDQLSEKKVSAYQQKRNHSSILDLKGKTGKKKS